MKLKSLPDDFEVEELSDFPLDGGQFAVYLLTKRSIGTPEAITAIADRWNIPRRLIGYGGLKDKHALTRQWITIPRGPKRDVHQDNLSLIYQGQASRQFTPADIAANRFHIVLRHLTPAAADRIVLQRDSVTEFGVPNYYDDQRFGSVGESGEFIAKPWCQGNYERALWLAIAEPNTHDRPVDRDEKAAIRACWGDWAACKTRLGKSSRRSVITYLVDHPDRFREAFALIRQDLRSLWLAAFQSELWNHCLAETLQSHGDQAELYSVQLGKTSVPFFQSWVPNGWEQMEKLMLPLPSARLHLPAGPLADLYETVVSRFGLAVRELRVKYPRDSFFSKGDRQAIVRPEQFRLELAGDDELNPGRLRVALQFQLPRGSYATILIKRLTSV